MTPDDDTDATLGAELYQVTVRPDTARLVRTTAAEQPPLAATTPVADTVASCGAALVHVLVLPVSTLPEASRTTAVAWVDWPTFNDWDANETLTFATGAGAGASI